jgi:hypothetical protein
MPLIDSTPPVVSEQDVREPTMLARLLRRFSEFLGRVTDRLENLEKAPRAISISEIRNALQSNGAAPLNLTNLVGITAQPQPSGVVVYSTLPTGPILQSLNDKQLILVTGTPNSLYYIQGGNPNVPVLITSSASTFTALTNAINTFSVDQIFSSTISKSGGFGSLYQEGSWSEEITLSTVGTTTNSTTDLPASSIILGVTIRITTTVTGGGVTGFNVGDPTTAARFFANFNPLTAGTASPNALQMWQGGVATDAAGPVQYTAAKLRITTIGGTPTAGKVRVVVYYRQFTAPTS